MIRKTKATAKRDIENICHGEKIARAYFAATSDSAKNTLDTPNKLRTLPDCDILLPESRLNEARITPSTTIIIAIHCEVSRKFTQNGHRKYRH